MDLATTLSQTLQPAFERFGIKLLSVNETEAVFLGPSFALHLYAFRDEVDLFYVERAADSKLLEFPLRPLTIARFTRDDNALYGDPTTTREVLVAGLTVFAAGLSARCEDLLRGQKEWLNREMWEGTPANEFAEQALAGKL